MTIATIARFRPRPTDYQAPLCEAMPSSRVECRDYTRPTVSLSNLCQEGKEVGLGTGTVQLSSDTPSYILFSLSTSKKPRRMPAKALKKRDCPLRDISINGFHSGRLVTRLVVLTLNTFVVSQKLLTKNAKPANGVGVLQD